MRDPALDLLMADVAELAERGIHPGAADVVRLYQVSQLVCNPDRRARRELLSQPVQVCAGVFFWPLTVGAAIWLEEGPETWWPDSPAMSFWGTCFALVHSRNPKLVELTDEPAAFAAVRAWMKTVPATADEIRLAADIALGSEAQPVRKRRKEAKRDTSISWENVLRLLEVQSGIPTSEWLFGRSARQTFSAYVRAIELRSALGGVSPSLESDDLSAALEAKAAVICDIIRQHKEAAK